MLFGYRMQAISILGQEVMQPRGLIGLGYDTLDHSGPEIAQVKSPRQGGKSNEITDPLDFRPCDISPEQNDIQF